MRPWISYMRHTTNITPYLIFILLSAPWKGQHTGKSSALKEQVGSAQDTSPFTASVAGEQGTSEWERGVFHPLPFLIWVPLCYLDTVAVTPQKAGIMQPVMFLVGAAVWG